MTKQSHQPANFGENVFSLANPDAFAKYILEKNPQLYFEIIENFQRETGQVMITNVNEFNRGAMHT